MKSALIVLAVLCIVLLVICLALLAAVVVADKREDELPPQADTPALSKLERLRKAGL